MPPDSPPPSPVPLFSVKNLTKTFPGTEPGETLAALDGASLDIREGECLVIAGSNGSGKTQLMRMVAALAAPDGGEVLFRGKPLFDPRRGRVDRAIERRLRRELGIVFQDADAQIVGETVAEDAAFGPENLGFSKEETAARVADALAAFGLSGRRAASPRRLSGGEKRRLAVAGAVAAGCRALILDEPFANLDWPGVVSVLRMIRDLKGEGRTLVVLTHELEKVLALADRLAILHKGRFRADGSPTEVLDALDLAWGVRDPRRRYDSVGDCSWLAD